MAVSGSLWTLVSAQWLYDTTGSAAQLGLLGVVQLVQMPLVLYGGILADIFDRKRLMVVTQAASFIMLLCMTFLAATKTLSPWHIFLATGTVGIVNLLGNSARPAMLPRVLPRELLSQGITAQIVTRQVFSVGAPLLFWGTYATLGVAASFGIATALALVSMIIPFLMRASGKPEAPRSLRDTFTSLKEGFQFIKGHRLLPGLYALDIGVVIFTFYRELFPVFSDKLYGMGAAGTSLLTSADAIGSIGGTLAVLSMGRGPRKGLQVIIATFLYVVLLVWFGLNPIFIVGLVLAALLGGLDSVSATMRQSIVQLTTPDKLIGRGNSAHSFAAMGANALGKVEVGLMAGAIGAGATLVVGGVIGLFVVVAVWQFVPSIRKYRYDPKNPFEKFDEPQPVGSGMSSGQGQKPKS